MAATVTHFPCYNKLMYNIFRILRKEDDWEPSERGILKCVVYSYQSIFHLLKVLEFGSEYSIPSCGTVNIQFCGSRVFTKFFTAHHRIIHIRFQGGRKRGPSSRHLADERGYSKRSEPDLIVLNSCPLVSDIVVSCGVSRTSVRKWEIWFR